jgi:hypothetical protein
VVSNHFIQCINLFCKRHNAVWPNRINVP